MRFDWKAVAIIFAGCTSLLGGTAMAQAPSPIAAPPISGDLSTRYRFRELYAVDDKAGPGHITSYRVASKETATVTSDNPQGGAPIRQELLDQVVGSERVAAVSPIDPRMVAALIRRYEGSKLVPSRWPESAKPTPLEGLTVWYRPRTGEMPEVIILDNDRRLLEAEYSYISTEVFTPYLALTIPELPVRIGDTWPLPRLAASSLASGDVLQGTLTGKLMEVRAGSKPPEMLAILGVTGRLTTGLGDSAVNARLRFAFNPTAPEPNATLDEARPIDARGAVVQVNVAQTINGRVGEEGRLRRIVNRQFSLERRLEPPTPPLPLPESTPQPTEANSWITYLDPKDRFHARLPQQMVPDSRFAPERLVLNDVRPEGSRDVIVIDYVPNSAVKPDDFFKRFFDEWRARRAEVIPGTVQTLPEADWRGRRVTRAEAAVKPGGGGPQRILLYGYVIQFGQNASLNVGVSTTQDAPSNFRKTVEAMLKTIKLGKPG